MQPDEIDDNEKIMLIDDLEACVERVFASVRGLREDKCALVLAIAQYPTDTMHLIFSSNGSDRLDTLTDTSFSFFDGMFVGSPHGGVEVLGIERTSYADQAGVKVGDEIVAVGNIQMNGDLNAFASAFSSVKAAAKENEQATFPMTVRSADGTTHTVALGMPPSIKSFINSGL